MTVDLEKNSFIMHEIAYEPKNLFDSLYEGIFNLPKEIQQSGNVKRACYEN